MIVARFFRSTALIALSGLVTVVVGCGGVGTNAITHGLNPAMPNLQPHTTQSPSPITHVVILVMENRSFDYMFNGYPGADTVQSGLNHLGQTIPLQQISLTAKGDLGHTHKDWVAAYDGGKMDGFDLESWDSRLPKNAPYSYAPQSEVVPDWSIAQQFTLADRTFESVTANSYASHQYLIAGQSAYAIGLPHDPNVWGCDSRAGTTVPLLNSKGKIVDGPFPCFDYQTLADLLDAASVSWRYYTVTPTYTWSAYDAISHIRYGSDWGTNIISPSSQFQTDVAAGTLAAVTWIVPTNKNSDHSGNRQKTGPSYVASIVNAIGQSQFYNSTALFVVWDEWGGWYDHVAPPQLDRMGLGFRIPMLVVSAWARHGYVSHVQHEWGSILHFAESNFGLGNLGQADARADDLSDCFDYTQSPPPFVPIERPFQDSQLRQIEATDRTPVDE